MDSTTWAALAFVLTVAGAVWTWRAYRKRGAAAGTRAMAWTLVPVALYLTGTLRLAGDIADDVSSWAARLVFSPAVWGGVIVAGLAAVLFVVSGWMLGRGVGVKGAPKVAGKQPAQVGATRASGGDDGLDDDVSAILRRHGIS